MTRSSASSSAAGTDEPRTPSGVVRWGPAALVALGAAVATAHGLYEVAVASKVPGPIAWLYPLVTDGLALVAYTATRRLTGKAAGYSWACVVLAAGLSGLAQAVFLAADTVQAAPALRFGVGAWPAIAAGLAAHLLHLLVSVEKHHDPDEKGVHGPHALGDSRHGGALPRPIPVRSSAEPQPEPEPEPTPAPTADPDPRVVAIARRLALDEELTGPAVAAELDVSPRTGRRLLGDARAHLDQQPRPHLVTTRSENPA